MTRHVVCPHCERVNFVDSMPARVVSYSDPRPEPLILRNADLEGVNLEYANLGYADLSGANLRNAHLKGVSLYNANLSNADLSNANLTHVNLEGVDLRGANLEGVDLRGADLEGVDLRGADLSGITMNWSSHDLIAHILNVAAKTDEQCDFAGRVLQNHEECWEYFVGLPLADWALDVLRPLVKERDGSPKYVRLPRSEWLG